MKSAFRLCIVLICCPTPSWAQGPPAPAAQRLSLEEAIARAESRSEEVAIATAGVSRSAGEQIRARAERFPQLSLTASYNRTLQSEFEGLFDQPDEGSGGDGEDGGLDFERLPFGRKNIWSLNLAFSQSLFTGGRVAAQERIARTGAASAATTLSSTRAQLTLEVVRAYYDAVLSERLLGIAEAAYEQAEATYRQTRLQREAGVAPEFELLRAQVARDNGRPAVIRSQSARRLAHLRLKQLLETPAEQSFDLTTPLDDETLPPPARFAPALASVEQALSARSRAPVLQAEQAVELRDAAVDIARSQRLPSIGLTSSYGRVTYPSGFFPDVTDFRTNWTIGAVLQIPILTGGRIRGDEMVARADAEQARALLQQTRELTELDTQSALEELHASLAAWEAGGGTVQQAARAYEIAELRYRQGISTQLELSDARLLLVQAQANRAVAARDLQVARARVALLPDLPLASGGGAAAGTIQALLQQAPGRQEQPRAVSPAVRAAEARPGSVQQ